MGKFGDYILHEIFLLVAVFLQLHLSISIILNHLLYLLQSVLEQALELMLDTVDDF